MLSGVQGKALESEKVVEEVANRVNRKKKVVIMEIFVEDIRAQEAGTVPISIKSRGDDDGVVDWVEGSLEEKIQDRVEAQCHVQDDVLEASREVPETLIAFGDYSHLEQDQPLRGLDHPVFYAGVKECVVVEPHIELHVTDLDYKDDMLTYVQ